MAKKRVSSDLEDLVAKKQRVGADRAQPQYIYRADLSNQDKLFILQHQLRGMDASTSYSSVVGLAAEHSVKARGRDAILAAFSQHRCSSACVVSSEAVFLLRQNGNAAQGVSEGYEVGLSAGDKIQITKAIVAALFINMSKEMQGFVLQGHGLKGTDDVEANLHSLRHHTCRDSCCLRVVDVEWYRCHVDSRDSGDDGELLRKLDRERKRREREEVKKLREEQERKDKAFWKEHWPQMESEATLKEILQESGNMARTGSLKFTTCSFCDKRGRLKRKHPKDRTNISLLEANCEQIREHYPLANAEPCRHSDSTNYDFCDACWRCTKVDERGSIRYFKKVPLFSWANACWTGDRPKALDGLTYAEEVVIARAHTTKCWTKVTTAGGSDPTMNQRAACGNVCIHPHEISDIATKLPRPINSLYDQIAVIIVSEDKQATAEMYKRTPLLARRGRILRALQWLKTHNPLYADIEIDEEALQEYSEDGTVAFPAHLQGMNSTLRGESTTYAGHGIDKTEALFQSNVSTDSEESIPMNRTGSIDVNRVEMSVEARKLEALRYIKDEGRFLKTSTRQTTLSTYEQPQTYGYLWPTLFPYGTGYFDDPVRKRTGFRPITTAAHVKHLLQISDRRFQLHTSFIFVMHNILVVRRSSYQSRLAVQRTWWPDAKAIINRVKAADFVAMRDSMLRKKASKDFSAYEAKNDDERDIMRLLRYFNCIDNHIEGSIGEVSAMREELRAISRCYGTPSIFLTINPADAHHPLTSFFAGKDICIDNLFTNPDSRYTCRNRAQNLANNPVAGAMFFHFMIERLIGVFLGCDRAGKRGVLGRVRCYYGVVENQNRGSLHMHMLIWLEGAKSPKEIQQRCESDPEFKQRFFDWLESIIKLAMPPDTTAQTKGPYDEMRRSLMGQPPLPQSADFDVTWPAFLREVVDCVGQQHTHGDVCFKKSRRAASTMTPEEKDQLCRFNLPAELVPTTYMDDTGKIHLKRQDAMMVGYNPTITGGNQCNTDIKFVGSGRLGMAMSIYMSNYTAKSTLDSAIVMSALCAAIAAMERQRSGEKLRSEDDQCRVLLLKTLNQLISRRELSGQQVASSLLGFPNHYTNAHFARVYWSSILTWLSNENFPFRRQSNEEATGGKETPDDAEAKISDEDGEEWVLVNQLRLSEEAELPPPRSAVYDVIFRPIELEHICWWDQIADYEKVTIASLAKKNKTQDQEEEEDANECNEDDVMRSTKMLFFKEGHPQCKTHALTPRSKRHMPVLIGFGIPRRYSNDITDKYAVAMLALFKPWRRDLLSPLKDVDKGWVETYNFWEASAEGWKRELMDHFEEVWECCDAADDFSSQRRKNLGRAMKVPVTREDDEYADVYEDPLFMLRQGLGSEEDEWDEEGEDEDEDEEEEFGLICSSRTRNALEKVLHLATLGSLYQPPSRTLVGKYTSKTSKHEVGDGDRSTSTDANEALAVAKAKINLERQKQLESSRSELSEFESAASGCEPRNTTLQEEVKRQEERMKACGGDRYRQWAILLGWQKLAIATCNIFTLNKEQRQVFLIIVDHEMRRVGNPDLSPLRLIIGGPGGSGKSHIYEALRVFYNSTDLAHVLAFTAPTGVAADNIQGATIHSFLSLNVAYQKLCDANSKARSALTERLGIVKTLIVDEAYFLSCQDLYKASKNIKVARGFTDDAFGSLDVIMSGDQFQLSCPVGLPLYAREYTTATGVRSRIQGQSDTVKREMEGLSAFREFTDCVILKEIVRQRNERYVAFVNRLRWGNCTVDGDDNDLDYIRQLSIERSASLREIGVDTKAWIEDPEHAAPLITYTNAIRDMHNWYMAKSFAAGTDQQFHTYYSEDTVRGRERGKRIQLKGKNAIAAWKTPAKQNADDLAGRLRLVSGMPVILVENLAVELGLCKSTRGTLVHVTYFVRDGRRHAVSALVEFPNYRGGESKLVTIPVVRRNMQFRIDNQVFHCQREQIPLVPGFAFTIHNSQSQSLHAYIAHLDSAVGTAAAYVLMSRIKCGVDDPIHIRIIGDIDGKKISTHAASQVRTEEERLIELAKGTERRMKPLLEWYENATGISVF